MSATLEVESGTNDPFAIFLTIVLVEILLLGEQSWCASLSRLLRDAILGGVIGLAGGRVMVLVLNRAGAAAGHARAVRRHRRAGDVRLGQRLHASGFLAVYIAGLIVGNRETRAHNSS